MPRNKLIQIRRGTTAQWSDADAASSSDPARLLAAGEPGWNVETGVYKIGDGASRWSDLPGFISAAALADANALSRLGVVGATDAITSRSTAATAWAADDDGGFSESFADLAAWIGNASAGQVSSGRMYANGGTTGLRRAVAGIDAGQWRLTAKISVVTGATAPTLIGFTTSTDETGADLSGAKIFGVGVSNTGTFGFFKGSFGWDASQTVTSGIAQNAAIPAGDYYLTIACTAVEISATLHNADLSIVINDGVSRSQLKSSWMSNAALTSVVLFNIDSRGTGGNAISDVVLRPTRLTGNPRLASENQIHAQMYSVPTSHTRPAMILTPAPYDSRKPLPFILYCHGYNEQYWGPTPAGEATQMGPAVKALLDAGYGVAVSDFGGVTNWGNATAVAAMQELYRHLRDSFPLGPVGVIGHSMGALVSLTTIAQRVVPGIAAWYGIEPACNLSWLAHTSTYYATAVKTAYGIAADASDYATKTVGFDPLANPGWKFRSLPMRVVSSPSDTHIIKTENADKLVALVSPYSSDVTILAATGDHTDPSEFQATDVVAFFNRTLSGGTPAS